MHGAAAVVGVGWCRTTRVRCAGARGTVRARSGWLHAGGSCRATAAFCPRRACSRRVEGVLDERREEAQVRVLGGCVFTRAIQGYGGEDSDQLSRARQGWTAAVALARTLAYREAADPLADGSHGHGTLSTWVQLLGVNSTEANRGQAVAQGNCRTG